MSKFFIIASVFFTLISSIANAQEFSFKPLWISNDSTAFEEDVYVWVRSDITGTKNQTSFLEEIIMEG